MLAVLTAASCLTAQDTLTIRSERIVDVCSSEKRWLIAPSLGRVTSQDSLMSFDITIGYDTLVTRPTDVLTEGTLSANLDFRPTMNLVIRGEMRIAGFNILNPMVGNKPLFAIAGEFLGTCTSEDLMTIPWPMDFNSEFKKMVTVYRIEPITAVANARTRMDVGTSFVADSAKINGKDSIGRVRVLMRLPNLSNTSVKARFSVADTAVLSVIGITATGATVESIVFLNGGVAEASLTQTGVSQPELEVSLANRTGRGRVATEIIASMNVIDTCSCVKAGLVDSMTVICENPMVSVLSSADKHNDNLKVSGLDIRCHCDYGQTNSINVFAITGQLVASTGEQKQHETFLSIESLPPGAYVVVGNCGDKRVVTMEIK
ncbi:MAG: hypothetical protein NTX15_08750 [Candidatus Kapabacteria bacterium]|nr:hypothetical protein [Candidatus Kapabacteria bacterium]